MLAATTQKKPFVIGDNPLTLQNMIDMSPRGNLGLAVTGIEIYYPMSPVRALAMWCPSLVDMVRRGAEEARRRTSALAGTTAAELGGVLALETAIRSGSALMYEEQNVRNFNSLQIARSERYVFSSVNDFRLARDILELHPRLKRGPRAAIA